jgi:hypothetical protein
MYDNVQESLECPSKDVIDDDDMLDGWFLVQSKKREQETAQKEFENNTKSDKIKNSSEVFMMASNKQEVDNVDNMNTFHSQMVKKQRFNLLKSKTQAEQSEFMDERLALQSQINSQFKKNVTGGH